MTALPAPAPDPEAERARRAALFLHRFPLPPVRLSMRARLLATPSLAAIATRLSAFPILKPQGEDR